MCNISIDTVRRANKRTIMQVGSKKAYSGTTTPKKSFNISVSVMGKVYSQNIPESNIRKSFSEAIKSYV